MVITIIILLILAAIAIRALTGENGLIKRAQDARILSELGKVNEAIEMYKLEQSSLEENGYYYTEADLEKNEKLIKKVRVNDTTRKVYILKDLSEIKTESNIGKGYTNVGEDVTNINKITELNDVYVKDLTDGKLYYVKDEEIWSVDGTVSIKELPFEKVETDEEWAYIQTDEDIKNNTLTLVEYKGSNTEVVVPNFYDGKVVRSIASEDTTSSVLKSRNSAITKVSISNGIEEIGKNAFYQCTGLTGNLTIPESITNIGNNAFYQCTYLTGNLIIPDKVTNVGTQAFRECKGFDGELKIGKNVIEIGEGAFRECTHLKGNIVIPNSVEIIGRASFLSNKGFNGTITIGSRSKILGPHCFSRLWEYNR